MIPETPLGAGPAGQDEAHRSSSGPVDASIAAAPLHVLRFLAAALRAKAVVEVGTGSGGSALHLLGGMVPDGVLTSIDVDQMAQREVREALREAGEPASRTRLIAGRPVEVLPRLAEGAYDMVVVASATTDHATYLALGTRLLRPGGVIVFAGVRPDADRDQRSATALSLRELVRVVQADEDLIAVTLPVGPGLLAVTKR
ncbi:O-methyltransferase [Saccharopolyspora cebuensis]|uniref:O-methyltransferase n=1 Tax=Saccharopolyspora cebuensis TaxID=418759 RepID=A0ABV4CKZ1_9PSEU